MRRVAALLSAFLFATACSTTDPVEVTVSELQTLVQSSEAKASAVYLWAPWSRPSLQLAGTFSELSVEYEPLGLRSFSVCVDDAEACEAALDGDFYGIREGFEDVSESLGFRELPALLIYDAGGQIRHRLSGVDRAEGLRPADIADAIEAALNDE